MKKACGKGVHGLKGSGDSMLHVGSLFYMMPVEQLNCTA